MNLAPPPPPPLRRKRVVRLRRITSFEMTPQVARLVREARKRFKLGRLFNAAIAEAFPRYLRGEAAPLMDAIDAEKPDKH